MTTLRSTILTFALIIGSLNIYAQKIQINKFAPNYNIFVKANFSNSGAFIAATYYNVNHISIFETATGKETLRLSSFKDLYPITKVFFNSTDRYIIVQKQKDFNVYNRRTGKLSTVFNLKSNTSLSPKSSFNQKTNMLTLITNDSIKLYKLIDSSFSYVSGIGAKNFFKAQTTDDEKYVVAADSSGLNIWEGKLENKPIRVNVPEKVFDFTMLKDSILLLSKDKFAYNYIKFTGKDVTPAKPFKSATNTYTPSPVHLNNNYFSVISYYKLVTVAPNGGEFYLDLKESFSQMDYNANLNYHLIHSGNKMRVIDGSGSIILEISSQVLFPITVSYDDSLDKGVTFADTAVVYTKDKIVNKKNLGHKFSGITYKNADWNSVVLFNGEVQVWSSKSESKLFSIKHPTLPSVIVTDEKTKMLYLSDFADSCLYKYNLVTGKSIVLRKENSAVTAIAVQNEKLLYGTAKGDVKSVDLSTGKLINQKNFFGSAISAIAPLKDRFIVASYGRMINLKSDFSDTTSAPLLIGHNGYIKSIAVQENGRFLATAAYDKTIKIWNKENNRLVKSYDLDSINADRVEIYKDNTILALGYTALAVIADSANMVKLMNPPLEVIVQSPNNNQSAKIIISPDGKLLATTDKNRVKIRDLKSGFLLREIKPKNNIVNGIAFSEDSQMIAIAGGKAIECFDPHTGTELRYLDLDAPNYSIHDVEFINNVIVGINSHGWHFPVLFHKNSGLEIGNFSFNQSDNKDKLILDLKYSPDKKRIATYGDKFIKLFDAATYKEIIAIPRRTTATYIYVVMDLLDFSPDSKYLLYAEPADQDQIRILNTSNGSIIKSHAGTLARFGNNGNYLFATKDRLTLANVLNDSKTLLPIRADVYINCMTFNALENVFAFSDSFGTIKMLEGTYGKLTREINRFDQYTYTAIQSPDKQQLLFNNQSGLFSFNFKTLARTRLPADNYPFTGAISPNSDYFYFQRDSAFYESNTVGEKERKIFDLPKEVKNMMGVKLSADGKIVQFTVEEEKTEYFYDIKSGKPLWTVNKAAIQDFTVINFEEVLQNNNGAYEIKINGIKNVKDGLTIVPAMLSLPSLKVTPIIQPILYNTKNWQYSDIGKSMGKYDLAVFKVSPSKRYFAYIDQAKNELVIKDIAKNAIVFTRQNPYINNVERLIFDPEEKYFLISLQNSDIELYDLTQPYKDPSVDKVADGFKLIATIIGNENGINSISLTNNLLLVTGSNSLLSIFDMKRNGAKMLSLIFVKDRDQVLIDHEGYYYSTKNAAKYLAFKKGDDIYPFDRFDYLRNRPDKIMEVLQQQGLTSVELLQAYKNAYNKRAQYVGDKIKNPSATDIPQLKVDQTALKQVSYTQQINIPIIAKSTNGNLSKLHISVNGVSYFGANGYPITTKEFQKNVSLLLSTGENIIRITAENEAKIQSYPTTLSINYTPAQPTKPNLYIITMSVSNYLGDTDLKYAKKDGQDMVSKFKSNNKFANVIADTLYDSKATRENFLAIKQKLLNTKPDDNVILFLSGHGLLDKKYNFYFATYDCDFNDPTKRGLAYTEIENLLDSIPARKKLMLLDACHSGEFDKESKKELPAMATGVRPTNGDNSKGVIVKNTNSLGLENSYLLMQDLFSNLDRASGSVVISAAAGDSYALESDKWKNGVFTYSILSGISDMSADLDHNNSITVAELREYVYKKVSLETGGRQKPTTRQDNLEFDWVVW